MEEMKIMPVNQSGYGNNWQLALYPGSWREEKWKSLVECHVCMILIPQMHAHATGTSTPLSPITSGCTRELDNNKWSHVIVKINMSVPCSQYPSRSSQYHCDDILWPLWVECVYPVRNNKENTSQHCTSIVGLNNLRCTLIIHVHINVCTLIHNHNNRSCQVD